MYFATLYIISIFSMSVYCLLRFVWCRTFKFLSHLTCSSIFYTPGLCHTEKDLLPEYENCFLYGNSFLKNYPFGNLLFVWNMKYESKFAFVFVVPTQ